MTWICGEALTADEGGVGVAISSLCCGAQHEKISSEPTRVPQVSRGSGSLSSSEALFDMHHSCVTCNMM
jgi:hypothetical protein